MELVDEGGQATPCVRLPLTKLIGEVLGSGLRLLVFGLLALFGGLLLRGFLRFLGKLEDELGGEVLVLGNEEFELPDLAATPLELTGQHGARLGAQQLETAGPLAELFQIEQQEEVLAEDQGGVDRLAVLRVFLGLEGGQLALAIAEPVARIVEPLGDLLVVVGVVGEQSDRLEHRRVGGWILSPVVHADFELIHAPVRVVVAQLELHAEALDRRECDAAALCLDQFGQKSERIFVVRGHLSSAAAGSPRGALAGGLLSLAGLGGGVLRVLLSRFLFERGSGLLRRRSGLVQRVEQGEQRGDQQRKHGESGMAGP